MVDTPVHVITGAFGYSGSYIARRLLDKGVRVRTITNSINRQSALQGLVEAHPFNFDQPDQLVESLRGASVLYNTYWVRFNASDFRHSLAVEKSLVLFRAAKDAGVQRVVHVSITNPSEESRLEYFHGKAVLERELRESGLSYAILRPAVLFGEQDILINNIAWFLRRFPVFGVFGSGLYRLQPIFVDDLASLAVMHAFSRDNVVLNAIGPETFTYRSLVETIAQAIGRVRPIVSVPPAFGYAVGWAIGRLVRDVIITKPEIQGLMEELLFVDAPASGTTRLSEWARAHSSTLGICYSSELARRRSREIAYRPSA